jgi:serine/threonine-protein kinase
MGTVYKAVDETLDREVAIKRLNPDLADPDVLKRFRAEAITLARLNHPHIATLFELTEHAGELLMVMEFVRGETFDEVSARAGAMPVDRAAQLCAQVLDALAYAHRAGVVHRDLKPANLMLTESGLAKVMDFGIARISGTEHLTNDGFMVGTPAYMSPEQVLGGEIDGRADLYAMGVVLYRLLTAQLPFKADSGIAMVHKQLNDPPTPVRQLRADLSVACEEVLTRALAKAPCDRYQTADDFRAALAALGGAAATGVTPTLSPPTLSPPGLASDFDPTLPPMLTPVMNVKPTVVLPPPDTPGPSPTPAVTAQPGLAPPPHRRSMRVGVAAAIGVLLFAGVTATGMLVWRARAALREAANTPVFAPPTSNEAAAAPATAPAPAAGAPTGASDAAAGTPSAGITKNSEAVPTTREPSGAKDAPSSGGVSVPIITFSKVKLLVSDQGKPADRDASLRLGTDGLQVLDGEKTLQSTAYSDVIGLFQSHSREPRWAMPDGTAVSVAKVGGKFGFLKGVPDWITVRTKDAFIPMRVQERELGRVIAELEARSGTKVVRAR